MAPITLITAPPIFMPLEQFADFQASTPASGSFDHEPVLHHLEKNALVTVNPGVDGFDHVKNQRGDLYVTEAALAFFNPETQTGFSVPYPTITLHATSRNTPDTAATTGTSSTEGEASEDAAASAETQKACIYCQLDETEPEDWDDIAEEDMPETREMYIYPENPAAVEEIYAALSRCATLFPSTDDERPPAIDFGSLITGNDDAEVDGTSIPGGAGAGTNGSSSASTSGEAGRIQQRRLEDLIDWNGYEPNGHANGGDHNGDADEDRMEDAVENQ